MAEKLDVLIADFRLRRKALEKQPIESLEQLNNELCKNLYPCMEALAEEIREVDAVIQEVVEQQESYISSELTAQILQTIALGEAVAREVEKLVLDDLTKRKMEEIIKAYRHSAEITTMGVADASTEEILDSDDDAEDTDDGDDNSEGEE